MTFPNTQNNEIRPGQIWRDGSQYCQERCLLVKEVGDTKIAVQNTATGKITKVRKEQFNRGKTGFFYLTDVTTLAQLNEGLPAPCTTASPNHVIEACKFICLVIEAIARQVEASQKSQKV